MRRGLICFAHDSAPKKGSETSSLCKLLDVGGIVLLLFSGLVLEVDRFAGPLLLAQELPSLPSLVEGFSGLLLFPGLPVRAGSCFVVL